MSTLTEQFGDQYNLYSKKFLLEAKKLHKAKWIYGFYGALDGLSNSFSLLKYFFDVCYNDTGVSSADKLHDFIMTPWGCAFVVFDTLTIMFCSYMGNFLDEDGYAFHVMTVEQALAAGYRNCLVWDENTQQLAYLSPESKVTVFDQDGEIIRLEQVKKIVAKARESKSSPQVSIKQFDSMILSPSFTRPPPTPTLIGSIVAYHPFGRDWGKAMKNTYKGLRNTFVLIDLLSISKTFHYIALPTGLALGVLAAINRTWLRSMRDERKEAKQLNLDLVKLMHAELSAPLVSLTLAEWEHLQNKIRMEHETIRLRKQPSYSQYFWMYARLSGAFSGLVDSPYLYFGALSLLLLPYTSWIFILVAASCCLNAITCLACRIYEEHNFQRDFLVTQLDVELVVALREIRLLRAHMDAVSLALFDTTLERDTRRQMEARWCSLKNEMEGKWTFAQGLHEKLRTQLTFSLGSVIMGGLKNGLDAYGAISSFMFAIATINLMLMLPFSPALVVAFVVSGLACMVLYTAAALIRSSLHVDEKPLEEVAAGKKLKSTLGFFAAVRQDIEKTPGRVADPWVQTFDQDKLESARLCGSAIGKAVRATDIIMTAFQVVGADGHYHMAPGSYKFAWINMIFFSAIFTLRGIARIGREVSDDIEEEIESLKKNHTSSVTATEPVILQKSVITVEVDQIEHPVMQRGSGSPASVTQTLSQQALQDLGLFTDNSDNSFKSTRVVKVTPVFAGKTVS